VWMMRRKLDHKSMMRSLIALQACRKRLDRYKHFKLILIKNALICCWKPWKEVFKIGWVVCIWRLVS
jgi:hypothetical protein